MTGIKLIIFRNFILLDFAPEHWISDNSSRSENNNYGEYQNHKSLAVVGGVAANEKIKTEISRCNKNELLFSIFLSIVFFLIIYYLVKISDSVVPIVDSITTSLSLVAMFLMARRKVENWIYWIIADLIYIPLYFYKGLLLTSFQFLIFLIIAILGYLSWSKKLNEKNINNRS